MLSQAENKNKALESKIKALTNKIQNVEKEFDQENTSPEKSEQQFDDMDNEVVNLTPFSGGKLNGQSLITQDTVNASFISVTGKTEEIDRL